MLTGRLARRIRNEEENTGDWRPRSPPTSWRARADTETLVETSPVGVVVFEGGSGGLVSFNREARADRGDGDGGDDGGGGDTDVDGDLFASGGSGVTRAAGAHAASRSRRPARNPSSEPSSFAMRSRFSASS